LSLRDCDLDIPAKYALAAAGQFFGDAGSQAADCGKCRHAQE
jgi:hypothetical protein